MPAQRPGVNAAAVQPEPPVARIVITPLLGSDVAPAVARALQQQLASSDDGGATEIRYVDRLLQGGYEAYAKLGVEQRADLVLWGTVESANGITRVHLRGSYTRPEHATWGLHDRLLDLEVAAGGETDALVGHLRGVAALLAGAAYMLAEGPLREHAYERAAQHLALVHPAREKEPSERIPEVERQDLMTAHALSCKALQRIGQLERALSAAQQVERDGARWGSWEQQGTGLMLQAQIAEAQSRWTDALALAERAVELYRSVGDERKRALALDTVAIIRAQRGELAEARRIHEQERVPVFQREHDVLEESKAWAKVASIRAQLGEHEAALRLLEDTVRPLQAGLNEASLQAETTSRIAEVYLLMGRFEQALQLYVEQVVPAYRKLDDALGLSQAYGDIAEIHSRLGHGAERARILSEEVLPRQQRMGDRRGQAMTRFKLAEEHFMQGHFEQALELALDSLRTFSAIGDTPSLIETYSLLSVVYASMGRLDEARRATDSQLKLAQSTGDAFQIASAYKNLGRVLQIGGDIAGAIGVYRDQALPPLRDGREPGLAAAIRRQLAEALAAQGQFEPAIRVLVDEVVPVFERNGDRLEQASAWGALADIQLMRADYRECIRVTVQHEVPLLRELGSEMHSMALSLLRLSAAHVGMADYDGALKLLEQGALPAFEATGDVQNVAAALLAQGTAYQLRGGPGDAQRARASLQRALELAERHALVGADQIRALLQSMGGAAR